LVERKLAKLQATGSNPVIRSRRYFVDDSSEIKKEWFRFVMSAMEKLGSRIDSLEEENKNIKKKLDKLSKRKKDA
jgi:hypothetical protein